MKISHHAIKRFCKRVYPVGKRKAHKRINTMLQNAQVIKRIGNTTFLKTRCGVTFIVENNVVKTCFKK